MDLRKKAGTVIKPSNGLSGFQSNRYFDGHETRRLKRAKAVVCIINDRHCTELAINILDVEILVVYFFNPLQH